MKNSEEKISGGQLLSGANGSIAIAPAMSLVDIAIDSAAQFRKYEAEHRAKGAIEKAIVNDFHATRLEAAIEREERDNELLLSFKHEDIGDIRHMILTMGTSGHGMPMDKHTKRVLDATIEAITLGLHIRDMDEVPDMFGDVRAFHQKFGQEYTGKPRMLPDDLFDFRIKFHEEETTEYAYEQPLLADAVLRQKDREIIHHLNQQLDALCDAAWVILGTADLQFGKKAFYAAWNRVVKANMAKVLGVSDPDAKETGRDIKYDIRKPDGWSAPDHTDLVQDHEHKIFRMGGEVNPGYGSDTRTI